MRKQHSLIAYWLRHAEPMAGQAQVRFLAQSALRANALAVADDEHPHHQLRVHRGSADRVVVASQVTPQIRKIDKAIDWAKLMTSRNVFFKPNPAAIGRSAFRPGPDYR
jgi:hypothetical protein